MSAHLKAYIIHYVTVIAGVCSLLAALDPKTLSPQGAALVSAASMGVAVAHALGIQPAQIVKTVVPIVLAALLLPLSGCATVSGWFASPASAPVITAVVDVAVATAEQKGVKAAQINAIAKQALAADSGLSATLATVAQVANVQIAKLNLPAPDLAAANILEIALAAAIQTKIGSNPSLAQAQAALAQVLQDAIAATGG
jgi:uncharacterized protein YceK